MIGVALKGPARAASSVRSLTAFAIVLGVAMISGSFVLTDTLSKSFDGIYEESYKWHRRGHQLEGARSRRRRRHRERPRSPPAS